MIHFTFGVIIFYFSMEGLVKLQWQLLLDLLEKSILIHLNWTKKK